MRLASTISVAEGGHSKQFTAQEFRKVMRSSNFVGACTFWRALDRLAHPEPEIRTHALGVLHALAKQAYEDCGGFAYSPQQAEAFAYCGLLPLGIRAPGSLGRAGTDMGRNR